MFFTLYNIPQVIPHNDTQEDLIATCGSSRLATVLVLMLAGLQWGSITLMTSCKRLSAVARYYEFAFASEAAWSHIYSAQYRHTVV